MKSISREGLDPSEIITKQNVLIISERIALRALRTVLSISFNRKLNRLYIGLNNDITHKNRVGYIYSDGYDLVQTAACFLCGHIGERLDTVCGKNKFGRIITVNTACFNEVNKHVMRLRKESFMFLPSDCPEVINLSAELKDTEEDFTKVDKIVEDMHLTDDKRNVLTCYMAGMGFTEIIAYLSLAASTVWKRRKALQSKYNDLMNL